MEISKFCADLAASKLRGTTEYIAIRANPAVKKVTCKL